MLGSALIVLMSLAEVARAGDNGDDFSNNLFSDLAPLLALFGERVTTQFMSQALGWADNFILAMSPLGVVTIIISAIRVAGPSWLRAIIGRARENRAAAEGELMSSTSNEVCELWDGNKVVRVAGEAPIAEFICLIPPQKTNDETQRGVRATASSAADPHVSPNAASSTTSAISGVTNNEFEVISLKEAVEKKYLEEFSTHVSPPWAAVGTVTSPLLSFWRKDHTRHDDTERKAQLVEDRTTGNEPKFIIVRNTEDAAPNLMLNIDRFSEQIELWTIAFIGIFLQLGVLVYSGFITYYPALAPRFKKGGKLIGDYAFPCTAAGTILLISGLLFCSHVVENSTLERRYRPIGMEARITYLQKPGIVNDQSFGSWSIFAKGSKDIITTSRPKNPDRSLENKTVISTLVSLCGFIIQFVGLRGMHWSATIVQLGATLTMTVLRAYVRRDLANKPASCKLPPGYELDWFATKLAIRFFPGDDDKWHESRRRKTAPPRRTPRPPNTPNMDIGGQNTGAKTNIKQSKEHPSDWLDIFRILGIPNYRDFHDDEGASARRMKDEAQHWIIDATNTSTLSHTPPMQASTANYAMMIRKGLADVAPWSRPVSSEAKAVARAVEATLHSMDGLSMSVHAPKEPSTVAQDDGPSAGIINTSNGQNIPSPAITSQTSSGDCITWALESRSKGPLYFKAFRQKSGKWKAPEDDIEAALSLWLYAVEYHPDGYSGHAKMPDNLGSDSQSAGSSRALWLLGANSGKLRRDLRWWLPNDTVKVMAVGAIEPSLHKVTELSNDRECHGIIGCAHKSRYSGWNGAMGYTARELERPYDTTSNYTCVNTWLAIDTERPSRVVFAQHVFGAFMRALANNLQQPIKGGADIQASEITTLDNQLTSWQSVTLQNVHLSRMARDIQATGLGTLEDAYLCLIPPLSSANKLPEMDSVVEWTHRRVVQSEMIGHRNDSGMAIQWLLETFPTVDPAGDLATSVAVAFLLSIAHALNYWEQQNTIDSMDRLSLNRMNDVQRELRGLKVDLEAKLREAVRPGVATLMKKYQQMGFCCVISTALRSINLECCRGIPMRPTRTVAPRSPVLSDLVTTDNQLRSALHHAVIHNPGDIDELLDAGANPDAQDILTWTPLHYSIMMKKELGSEILVRRGAEVGIRSRDGSTPLHCAAMVGSIKTVVILINAGADPNELDVLKNTALHLAALNGHDKVVQYLLPWTNRATCNSRTALHQSLLGGVACSLTEIFGDRLTREWASVQDARGRTALHYAAWSGQTPSVISDLIQLMEGDWKLEGVTKRRPSAFAAWSGFHKTAQQLFDVEKDRPEYQDSTGATILHYAAAGNCTTLIQNLIDHEPECVVVKDTLQQTALHYAAMKGSTQSAKVLLQSTTPIAYLSAQNDDGKTALDLAAQHGQKAFVQYLVPDWVASHVWTSLSSFRRSPLHSATKVGDAGLVRYLVEKGYPVNARDEEGRTALHSAAKRARVEIAEILLSQRNGRKGLKIGDLNGTTPLAYAAQAGRPDMVELLISKNADLEQQDSLGDTALLNAAYGERGYGSPRKRGRRGVGGQVDAMRVLVEKGANWKVRNKKGLDAKDIVLEGSDLLLREPMVTYLEDLQFKRVDARMDR